MVKERNEEIRREKVIAGEAEDQDLKAWKEAMMRKKMMTETAVPTGPSGLYSFPSK